MAKTIQLLLTETVENLGIVGDVVTVRSGYARNFLLPRQLATDPSEEKIKALAERRAEAERDMAQRRQQRAEMIQKLEGFEATIERSCNDQGLLYGSVTQQDVVSLLAEHGYTLTPRDVRLTQTIKRIDSYEVLIKLDQDLESSIKLWVVSDRPLDLTESEQEGAAAETAATDRTGQPAEEAGKEAVSPASSSHPA